MLPQSSNEWVQWIHILFRGDQESNPYPGSDEYVSEFAKRDATATTIPILSFQFKNILKLANILSKLPEPNETQVNNGLIITSPRVVEALQRALSELDDNDRVHVCNKLNRDKIFVVGPKSGEICKTKLGLDYNKDSTTTGTGRALAEMIETSVSKAEPLINLIYPKGSKSGDLFEQVLVEIPNIKLHPIIVYETQINPNILTLIRTSLTSVKPKSRVRKVVFNLIFFSPSGVEGITGVRDITSVFEESLPDHEVELKYSSIGKTTRDALLEQGLIVFCVADHPTPTSLVDSCLRQVSATVEKDQS